MLSGARRRLLHEMGVVVWQPRARTEAAARPPLPGPATHRDHGSERAARAVTAMQWPELERAVAVCTACALHRTRTRTVFGTGALDADLLVVGEAPGEQEDLRGEPFVGRAGQLLNAMLRALGFAREQVYIANTLKCRPPRNRDPAPEETASCAAFLERQAALVRPRAVLALGRIAAQTLLASDAPLARLRGRLHRYPGSDVALVVTYHPAYLLRAPARKRHAWSDLLLVRRALEAAGGQRATREPGAEREAQSTERSGVRR